MSFPHLYLILVSRLFANLVFLQANMSILQGQGRLTAAQRTEFYKQYYQEMIRRGAEGLRNMNVPVDQPGPAAAAQTPAPTAANAV